MERIKKYLVGLLVLIIIFAAIVTALRMSGGIGTSMHQDMDVSSKNMMSVQSGDSVGMMRGSYGEMMSDDMAAIPTSNVPEDISVEKKEIKNGSITMRVNDVDRAMSQIKVIAEEYDGEVYSSNFYQGATDLMSGSVEVRVPVARFFDALAALKGVATVVVGESTYGQDVTMAYQDLQARLKNKQAEERSFLALLERSGELTDVINVTREVSRVRGEIEQLQAQITFMEAQTDFATIMISITEDENVTFSDQWRPMQVAKETVNGLLSDMQGFVNFVIVLVIRVIPIIVLYSVIAWFIYAVIRKIIRLVHKQRTSQVQQEKIIQ